MNVQDPNDELEPECLGKPFETECLAKPLCQNVLASRVTRCSVCFEGRMHIVTFLQTLDIQCIQKVTYAMSTTTPFAVIVDNACFQTKGANCRLDETRAKWL